MLVDNYANVNGVCLHYVGTGTGPLILFLHGFPEFWYAWKNQLTDFGSDHHAVALDMRGFNLSDKPTDVAQYRLDILVEDIRAFAAHLSPTKNSSSSVTTGVASWPGPSPFPTRTRSRN